jgi:hypothetical protein
MTATGLMIVLPACDEGARPGPTLDEMFGYLRPHGELHRRVARRRE